MPWAFSPDSQTIVTGSYDTTAQLWDAAIGQPVGKPMEHRGTVYAVSFSPDGQTILDRRALTGRPGSGIPLLAQPAYARAIQGKGPDLCRGIQLRRP